MPTTFPEAKIIPLVSSPYKVDPERLQRFFDLSLEMLCTTDGATNTFLDLNPAWERTLGWTAEDLQSRPFTEFVHPGDRNLTSQLFRKMQEEERSAVHFENRYQHKDGRWLWLSWVSTYSDGLFYSSARDITAYKHALAELQRANDELGQFAYAASHDLQEPLRAITGHLGFLNPTQLDERGQQSMHYVLEGARHMQLLIEGLLELSRVESTGGAMRPCPMRECVERALSLLEPAIQETDAQISVEGAWPVVSVDRVQMVRAFQNVIANSLKFRKPGEPARVHISVEEEVDRWEFVLTDQGVGLEPKRAPRAFQIFQRLHARSEYEGMGVGLALVQRIMQRHGGHATIKGEVDKGVTIRLVLPKVRPLQGGTR